MASCCDEEHRSVDWAEFIVSSKYDIVVIKFTFAIVFADELLVANVIDINVWKVLILREMCFFVSEDFQEILTSDNLAFCCKVVHEKLQETHREIR